MFARLVYWLWAFITPSSRFWQALESAGITIFVGPNGSGKSLVMVQSELGVLEGRDWTCFDVEHRHHKPFRDHAADCFECDVPSFLSLAPKSDEDVVLASARGALCETGAALIVRASAGVRRVFSTVPLTESKGVPHPRFVPLTDFHQLLAIEHADVLFDEVAGIADASGSGTMPVQVINWQHKLRKADIRQRVTTPAYARCALPIRQVAQVVVECRSLFPVRSSASLWRPRRIVRAVAYDAWEFEDFIGAEGQRDRLKPLAKGLLWVPTARALEKYNSFGQVLQLGHVTEGGTCVTCGGAKPRPKCGCDPEFHTLGLDPSEFHVERETTAGGAVIKRAVVNAAGGSDE